MQVEIQLAGKPNRWIYQQRHIRIGRDSSCDISLPSAEYPMVSREHVVLEFNEGILSLSDPRSENGTYLRGQRVNSGRLQSGDTLRLGVDGPELQISLTQRGDRQGDQTMAASVGGQTRAQEMATRVVSRPDAETSIADTSIATSGTASPTVVFSPPTIVSGAPPATDSPTTVFGGVEGAATQFAHLPESPVKPPQASSRPREIRIAMGNDPETPLQTGVPEAAASALKLPSNIGDLQVIEQKLNGIRTLLKVNLAAVLILILGLLYANQQIERNRKAVVELRTQAQSALGQFEPELDTRLTTFDKRMDSMDGKMKSEEDQFVLRMNTEIPAMLDKYIDRKLSDAKRQVPAVRP
jgi:pSer/pThr/pTyr-binding forkhead associated (FHA) protein